MVARPVVFAHNGTVYASSLQVAEFFEKDHRNVLATIRGLLNSQQTPSGWFVVTNYVNDQNGESYPAYNLTRDGLALLTMGFSGPRALGFKVSYIEAFNAMERALSDHRPAPQTKVSGDLLRETRKLIQMAAEHWHLSASSQQTFAASLFRQVGIDLPEPLVERHHSTTELAKHWSMPPNTFGKKIKHLKTPGNGQIRLTTAPHGKQVEQWVWNEHGRAAIAALMDVPLPSSEGDKVVPFGVDLRGGP
jgi:Rha family phage regulatory protein